MKIARVFPRRTAMSPTDTDAYYDEPGLFTPYYDEAWVSVTFTWDRRRAEYLANSWRTHAKEVKIGGPAYGDPGGEFTQGRFLKNGCGITHRGCCNRCWFCDVWKREGPIKILPIVPHYIIEIKGERKEKNERV